MPDNLMRGAEMAKRTVEERFWEKVDPNGPIPVDRPELGQCWLWTASTSKGYGKFHDGDNPVRAHRYAYALLVAPIPEGFHLDHLCCVRSCVRPLHLEPVTPAENTRRSRFRMTHCRRGHAYTAENTYRKPSGRGRECRICRTTVTMNLRRRKKTAL